MVHRKPCGVVSRVMIALTVMLVLVNGSPTAQDKQRIAVLELAQQGTRQEAEAIAEELRKIFVKSNQYLVVDRTLTAQILKEWETQQTGLTDGEKAVKIGKLFNVQLIVSGKLNKFPSGGWQLSAVMLNAQSGVAMKAETVRHRGDFFSLLDTKVPALGAALAGFPASATSVGPAAKASAAGTGPKKLAIYPALYSGKNAKKVERTHDSIANGIKKMIERDFAGKIAIVREFSSTRGFGGERDDRLSFSTWKGNSIQEPNEEFAYKSASKMGVDLVLLYETTVPGGGRGEHRVYLFDAVNAKNYQLAAPWKRGQLGKDLVRTVKQLIKKYRHTR